MGSISDDTPHGKIHPGNLPAKLRSYRQFVVWRYEDHGEKKPRKVPYNPNTGENASVNNPQTWGTLDEAITAYNAEDYSGIGFMFSKHGPFAGIDLDKCRNPTTGEVEPWARDIMERVGGWWEISPSGTGFHCITEMTAPLPPHGRKKGNIEIYETGRYFTLTGNHVEGTSLDVEDCTQGVLALHKEIFGGAEQRTTTNPHPAPITNLCDAKLLRVANRAKNGEKFTALWKGDTSDYPSHSHADLALCSLLAFYCGGEAARIDRLFRQSGLYRSKWDREGYREDTIQKAIDSVPTSYDGKHANPKASEAVSFLYSLIATYPWKGVVGSSARLVLTALSQSMEQTGKDAVSVDCRSIAEMTGLRFTTVAKTFRRLCGVAKDKHDHVPVCLTRIVDKTVICTDSQASRHAYSYRLSEDARNAHTLTHFPPSEGECAFSAPCLETLSHDAFRCRGRGLTRSAGLVLGVLPCRTAQQIAERTHISLRTVRNALASLKAENIVEKNAESGVWERTCESLDAVAERRRTAGASERQKRLHQIQREMFSALLNRIKARGDGMVYKLHPDVPTPVWEGTWEEAA